VASVDRTRGQDMGAVLDWGKGSQYPGIGAWRQPAVLIGHKGGRQRPESGTATCRPPLLGRDTGRILAACWS